MAFIDILGNERQKKILRRALQKKRIPNSLLFCGSEGVGKESMALLLAKAMNCEKKRDDACEICSSCRAINRANFPDVMVISPDENVIKIDQMRILKKTAYLRPMVGKKRVFIVTEAEKMNEEASNSLLKILEEPPLFSHIVLVTANLDLIKPTIKSRCQILNFQPISREDIEKILIEQGYGREKAKIVSLLVRGNLKRALSLEWEEIQGKRKQAWELFVSLIRRENAAAFIRNYASPRSLVWEELEQVLEILSSYCRDLILIKERGGIRFLMNPDYLVEYRKIEGLLSLERSMDYLEKIDYALYVMPKNVNMNLLVTSLFSYMIS